MAREYFPAYHSYLEVMEALTDAEKGRLFTACLLYSKTGEVPQLSGHERYLFPAFKSQIDRDKKSYDEYSAAQAEKARKRWDATACNGMSGNAENAKEKEKEKTKKKEKENNAPPSPPKGGGDVFAEYAGENRELLAALRDFEQMRKSIKRPMTDRAKRQLCTKLDDAASGYERIELLNEAVLHCWQSVYPKQAQAENTRKKTFAEIAAGMEGQT